MLIVRVQMPGMACAKRWVRAHICLVVDYHTLVSGGLDCSVDHSLITSHRILPNKTGVHKRYTTIGRGKSAHAFASLMPTAVQVSFPSLVLATLTRSFERRTLRASTSSFLLTVLSLGFNCAAVCSRRQSCESNHGGRWTYRSCII